MIRVEIEDPKPAPRPVGADPFNQPKDAPKICRVTVEFDINSQHATIAAANMIHAANREISQAENPTF